MGKKTNVIRLLSIVTTVVGFCATQLSNYVADQKMKQQVKEEVAAAMAEQNNDNEEEEA